MAVPPMKRFKNFQPTYADDLNNPRNCSLNGGPLSPAREVALKLLFPDDQYQI